MNVNSFTTLGNFINLRFHMFEFIITGRVLKSTDFDVRPTDARLCSASNFLAVRWDATGTGS